MLADMSGANLIPLGVRAGGGGGGFGRDAELLSLLKGAGRGLDRSKKGKKSSKRCTI